MSAFFLGLATVLAAGRLLGALAGRLGQPAVIGEILAGVVLGPTVLPARVGEALVPADSRPLLGGLAAVGLATFVFVVGHGISLPSLPGGRTAAAVAGGSVLVPLGGGCLVALPFADTYGPAGPAPFVAFVGVAMAATAFPVLARILTDRGLDTQPVGRLAMSAAAITDAVIWVLLAVVVAGAATGGRWRIALVPVFVVVLAFGLRPLLACVLGGDRIPRIGEVTTLALLVVLLMLCCATAEWLGVHYVFGAVAFGVVVARSAPTELRGRMAGRVGAIGAEVFLPVYFVTAGLQVDLSGVGAGILGVLGAVIAIAVVTKFAGAYTGARLSGLSRDDSLTLGVLMNTRGLTEIVVLTAGQQVGLIDGRFYSAMVAMAVVTTAMTGPLLTVLNQRRRTGGQAGQPRAGRRLGARTSRNRRDGNDP